MNIAPLVAARLAGLSLGSESTSFGFSGEPGSTLRLPPTAAALSRIVSWDETNADHLPVGLYLIPGSIYGDMIAGGSSLSTTSDVFIRAAHLDTGDVLLFPDDSGLRQNYSVFAPTRISADTIALHHLELGNYPSDDATPRVRSSTGCTPGWRGSFPNRTFVCTNSGCPHDCSPFEVRDTGGFGTLACPC